MKSPLELIKDTASGLWRTLKPEEFREAEKEVEANREMRRTAVHMAKVERRKARPSGPGYQAKKKRGQTRKWPHRAPKRRRRNHVGRA